MQGLQPGVLRGVAALAGHVDDQQDLAGVGLQRSVLAVDVFERDVINRGIGKGGHGNKGEQGGEQAFHGLASNAAGGAAVAAHLRGLILRPSSPARCRAR